MALFTQVTQYLSCSHPATLRHLPKPLVKHMFRVLFQEDYPRNFTALLPYLKAEATHFTLDSSLLQHLNEGVWDRIFNCHAWKKLTALSLRGVGYFTLHLPFGLEELYIHNKDYHVLPSWSVCERVVVDWDEDLDLHPYYPNEIRCEEFLIKRTDIDLLILLFNSGFAYVGPVMYRPPEAFSIFGWHDTVPPPPVSMEKFVEGSPPKYDCPVLHYETSDENEPLIKACIERMMEDARLRPDVYTLITALNDIQYGRWQGADHVADLKARFSHLALTTEEARMWRDHISQCFTDFDDYFDEGYDSQRTFESEDDWEDETLSEQSDIGEAEILGNESEGTPQAELERKMQDFR